MTNPDGFNFGVGRAMAGPGLDPAADVLGPTHPARYESLPSQRPRAVPGVTVGFSAKATRSTVVQLPFMQLPLVGFVLAVIAGLMNAYAFLDAGVFATVQSGNVLLLALAAASFEWTQAVWPLISILAFGLGAFLTAALTAATGVRGRSWTTWALVVLGLVTAGLGTVVLIGAPAFGWVAAGLAFVGGAMGSAYHKEHNMLFGALAVTFLLQMTFHFLARAAFGRREYRDVPNISWAGVFFSVLLGFFLGALTGGALIVWVGAMNVSPGLPGAYTLWAAGVLFWVLAAFSKRTADEGEPID